MESLAPEILICILDLLDLNSILKCRQVSRKFKTTIELNFRPKGLTCKARQSGFEYASYPFNHESIRSDTLFSTDNLSVAFLDFPALREPLKNLQQANINFSTFLADNPKNRLIHDVLTGLNRLHKLRRLRIELLHLNHSEELNLPLLQYLAVLRIRPHRLRIVAPCLIGFETELDLHMFEFSADQYQQISELKMKAYHSDITKFKNLQRLSLERLYFEADNNQKYEVPVDLLKSLEQLTELHWTHCYANRVPSLLNSKYNLERTEFRPYYNGMLISQENLSTLRAKFDSSRLFDPEHCFELILRNFDTLPERLPFNHFVNFNVLLYHYPEQVTELFFKKFTDVRKLECGKIGDEIDPINEHFTERFTEFLKQCKCLVELRFVRSGFGQEFFNQLNVYQPLLAKLAVLEHEPMELEFIFDLHNLSELEIDYTPTYELIIELFARKAIFRSLHFSIDGRIGQIYSSHLYGKGRHFFRVKNCAIGHETRELLFDDLRETLAERATRLSSSTTSSN